MIFGVPGESRLIRARPGYRPIVLIEEPKLNAVKEQPGVFTLVGKNLILDGIDLIVNVRDLPPNQTALFSCAGANLTLRNCSITILNGPSGSSFEFIRAESSPSHRNPCRILLEKTLVRGSFATGINLAGGSTELVLHKSVIVGGPGPSVRSNENETGFGKPRVHCREHPRWPWSDHRTNDLGFGRSNQAALHPGVWLGVRTFSRGGYFERDLLDQLDFGR